MIGRASFSASCLVLACLSSGCGAAGVGAGKGFDSSWQNDNGASIAAVEQRLSGLPPVPNARVVVALNDAGLLGASLDGKSTGRTRASRAARRSSQATS